PGANARRARSQSGLQRLREQVRVNATTLVAIVVVGLLVLPPLFTVVYSSFVRGDDVWHDPRTLGHYRDVLGSHATLTAFLNTLVFAAGSAVLSVAAVAVIAFLVERTNAAFRRVVYVAVIVSFGVPTVIQTMGWVLLIGPNSSFVNTTVHNWLGSHVPTINLFSMHAMIFVQSTLLFPAIYLLVAPSLRATDSALEQAAAVSGASRVRTLLRVTLPLVAPSLLAAALLGFIVSIEAFEVPALIGSPAGIRVLSTMIYGRINTFAPDYGAAAAFATVLMAVTIVGLWAYQRATRHAYRYATVTGKGYRPQRLDLGPARWAAGAVLILVALLVAAPILILLWTSLLPFYSAPSVAGLHHLTLANYTAVIHTPGFVDAAKNSVLLGAATALVVVGITVVCGWSIIRRRNPLSRLLDQVASLPLVAPGIVLSLAILRVFIRFPVHVYGTLWVLVIAFAIHYLPYGVRYSSAGVVAIHPELEEAAAVGGAGQTRILASIVAPLLRPTLFAAAIFVFMSSLRQLSLVVLLTGVNVNVVASEIFALWGIGSLTQAATASMLVVAAILLAAGLLYRWMGLSEGDAVVVGR
ncbi:MAG: iron ABC transporter permease, partial [Actinomycetota bacterium]